MRKSVTPLLMTIAAALSAAVVNVHAANPATQRALLISVDGMHAIDLALYVTNNPGSAMAELSNRGVTYTNAHTPLLGDSTPGLASFATGGSPAVFGLPYSPFYDRALSPPGSDCSTKGAVYYLDEKWVKDNKREDSGGGIDESKLPRDGAKGCKTVYPRDLIRVNTMFDVVKKSGGRTAWIDQHDLYIDFLRGMDGKAVDDSRALERKGTPGTYEGMSAQDGRRVDLLLNQIRGFDSNGTKKVGVPRLFGLGFISFGAMQKKDGYADSYGTPKGNTKAALEFVDQSLARIVGELKKQKLFDSTMIILSAKHGQSPIDIKKRRMIDRNVIRNAINGVQPGLHAHASLDTIGLIWLKDGTRTADAVAALEAKMAEGGIQKIYAHEQLNLLLPVADSRTPDIIIQPELGAIYADNLDSEDSRALIAEHGGMLDEDTNVPLLVSYKGGGGRIIRAAVQTSQVAPTVLTALGIAPDKLKAVQLEGTQVLPALNWNKR